MQADFLAAFNTLKDYLAEEVPELGQIITHWEDPFLVSKNRTIILPDAHSGADRNLSFNINLWISTIDKNADAIVQAQILLMEKLYLAIYDNIPSPIVSASIAVADYFDPTPQSPNVGLLRVLIMLTTDFLDDCR